MIQYPSEISPEEKQSTQAHMAIFTWLYVYVELHTRLKKNFKRSFKIFFFKPQKFNPSDFTWHDTTIPRISSQLEIDGKVEETSSVF